MIETSLFSFKLSELVDLLQKRDGYKDLTRKEIRRKLIDNIDFYLNTLTITISAYDL